MERLVVPKRYETLDGMRGLCALLVVILHTEHALRVPMFSAQGYFCVDMFFVLSGFVIALTYEERLKDVGGFRAFLKARGHRLIPTQTIGTLICAFASFLENWWFSMSAWEIVGVIIAGLFLLPLVWTPLRTLAVGRGLFPANPPIWSLHGELVINLIYGAVLHRLKNTWLSVFCFYAFVSGLFLIHVTAEWTLPFQIIFQASFGFTLGVILFRLSPLIRRLPKVSPWFVYVTWGLICCVPFYGTSDIFIDTGIELLAMGLVALLIRNEQPVGTVLRYLGRLSYPLYASHMAVMIFAALIFWPNNWHNRLLAIPMVAAALFLAAGIDHLVSPVQSVRAPKSAAQVSR